MRKLITILLLCLLSFWGKAQTPTANAGTDQTIYLSSTSTVTLTGTATNRSTSTWTEVSTDYMSGATITTPSSLTTTVTGLPQGVFYFKLDVNNGSGVHAYDTVVIHVNLAPVTSATKIHFFDMNDTNNLHVINDRTDTVTFFPNSDQFHSQSGAHPNKVLLFRDRSNGIEIDNQHSKVINMIEDGYGGESNDGGATHYARSEFSITQGDFTLDTTHTYIIEWQCYFPQSAYYLNVPSSNPTWYAAVVMFQIHGNDAFSPPVALYLGGKGQLYVSIYNHENAAIKDSLTLAYYPDFYNKAHTIRVTMREGQSYPGQDAFLKIDVDGVQKYYQDTTRIGAIAFQDYLKFSGLYDYGRHIVDPDSLSRARKFKMVTNYMNVYTQDAVVAPPTISMSGNQTITTSSTTVSAVGTPASGQTITGYSWTKISGNGSITSPISASTGLTGLDGTSVFQCTVTQSDGQTASGQVTITANLPAAAPTITNSGNKTTTIDSASITATATWASGHTGTYHWTQISGPNTAVIFSFNSASTWVKSLINGTYVFRCTGTQDDGQTATTDVTVTVNIPAPTLTTSGNQTILGSTATVSATATFAPSTTGTYLWTLKIGTGTISSPNASSTGITGITGTSIFTCKATQSDGQSVSADVSIHVDVPPTANAGADQTVSLPSSVTLAGSGTDGDGTIVSYSWSKVSGGSYTISNSQIANPVLTNLVQGAYTFRLTVTDNNGATGTDDMNVTVNAAGINNFFITHGKVIYINK